MDKRTTLALLLMAALALGYQLLFLRQEPVTRTPAKTEAPAAPAKAAEPPSAPITALPPAKEVPAVPERTAVVETPLYRAAIGSLGGQVQGWELHYRGQKPMVVPGGLMSHGLVVSRAGQPARPIRFALSTDKLTLGPDAPSGQIVLTGEDGYGLRITETLTFKADSYVVDRQIKVENRHTQPQSAELFTSWATPIEVSKGPEKFQGQHPIRVVRMVEGSVHREVLAKTGDLATAGQWIGLESEWYLTALIPHGAGMQVVESKLAEEKADQAAKPHELAQVGVRIALPTLKSGQAWEGQVQSYSGPKEYERLRAAGSSLEKSIYFGGFPIPEAYGGLPMGWLVVPTLWVMHRFYGFTHNYGVAIILLTVITKVLFFPLTIKSMTSMRAMQALQPQINALRSKYKSDPQRLQRETMELYRAHKVNPLGGCLPMVVQIPIFYALYVALSVSVELQNAPFICLGRLFGVDLWICDLAAHDPTYVLPILMGISMFIQQKMTPVMGDPRQAKMMLFMPVVFTFMFLNLPSGLVLYWTLSNVLQIAQQMYMQRVGPKAEKAPARATKKA